MDTNNPIFKSGTHKSLGGVCAGIALSKGWSITLTRVATLFIICSTGFVAVLLYLLFWIFLPRWDSLKAGPEPQPLPHDPVVRDPQNKIVGGVCGAIARYFGWDAALVRIAFALLVLLAGVGLIPYFYAWIVIPAKSRTAAI